MNKYIDADEFAKDLERLCDIVCQYSKKQRDVMCRACTLGDAIELLDNQPAADVAEVRHGRWKCVSIGRYACSLCGCEPWYEGSINTMHYCSNCGANMDEEV